MKMLDKILGLIGTDKVLHFLVGGWVASLAAPLGWMAIAVAVVLILGISIYKEERLDASADYMDIVAALTGCAVSVLVYWVITLTT